MGAGFLPGLLQGIHGQLIDKFQRLDRRRGKASKLYVRFHIDNTAAKNENAVERDRVMELINLNPIYGTPAWADLLKALRETDQLFVAGLNKVPQRVDLALRRGGFVQPCILLDDPHRAATGGAAVSVGEPGGDAKGICTG